MTDFHFLETAWCSFTSLYFWVLFIAFFTLFLLLKSFSQRGMLLFVLAFNLFFAFCADIQTVCILAVGIPISFYLTKWMDGRNEAARTGVLLLTVGVEIFPLLYFKLLGEADSLLHTLLYSNFSPSALIVPVGLSFFSLQAVSYSVDVYRKQLRQRPTLLEYAFFLSFFPLLLAGPITRAGTLLPQLRRRTAALPSLVYGGLFLIGSGLVKKMLVADYIATFVNPVFADPKAYESLELLFAALGFTAQIYADFSAYSDLAIGLASLLGIHLPDNFRAPYAALNLTDFWRCWHISLSSWLRDYVYIPLGGSRHGFVRTILHLFITFILAGLWHGGTVVFLLWGVLHAFGVSLHKLLQPLLRWVPNVFFVRVLSWIFTFSFLVFSWILFRASSVEAWHTFLTALVSDFSWNLLPAFVQARPLFLLLLTLCVVLQWLPKSFSRLMAQHFSTLPFILKFLLGVFLAMLLSENSTAYVKPFLYAAF